MEQNLHSTHGVVVQNTLVTLPIEVLVYICSFLSVRHIVKVRCVSRILRHVGETPSLWKTFIWSLYPPRDSELLEHVLKMFGEHVKQFHFADVPPSKLEVMLKFCKNVTHLSLPRFTYYGEFGKLEKIVCSMTSLQILDIQSCTNIDMQQLFKLASNLKELSILRHDRYLESFYLPFGFSLEMIKWIEQWANSNYLPRKLNVVLGLCNPSEFLKDCLTVFKNKKVSNILDLSNIAWFNISFQMSADLVVPCIQVRITDLSVTLSSVSSKSLGLDLQWKCSTWGPTLSSNNQIFHLTQGRYHGKKVHIAWLIAISGIDEYIDNSVTSLASVTYFDGLCALLPEHLEWLSIACPNLQTLDLSFKARCLRDLQGLRSIAENCKNFQSLNLTGIGIEDIDPEIYGCIPCDMGELWEILCSMRLTELSIEGWMIRGASKDMFQNYLSLQTLKVTCQTAMINTPSICCLGDGSLSLFSYFPSITSCKLGGLIGIHADTLKRIFSWRHLRCLLLHFNSSILNESDTLLLKDHCTCLQELYIYALSGALAETSIDALCGHGGLEHVILNVKSLTTRSITSLIEHSPNLVTFEITLCPKFWKKAQIMHLIAHVRTRFYKTQLINGGLFSVKLYNKELHNDRYLKAWML